MLVLFILLASLVIFRALGTLGVDGLSTWSAATRYALAVMLVLTASAHFTRMREDLVRDAHMGAVAAWDGLFHWCLRALRRDRPDYPVPETGGWHRPDRVLHFGVPCKCEGCQNRVDFAWPTCNPLVVTSADAASVYCSDLVVQSLAAK